MQTTFENGQIILNFNVKAQSVTSFMIDPGDACEEGSKKLMVLGENGVPKLELVNVTIWLKFHITLF